MMNRVTAFSIAAIALLASAGAIAARPRLPEHPPAPALSSVPTTLAGWSETGDAVPTGVLVPDPSAAVRLARTYRKGDAVVWVAVDYYADQSDTNRPSTAQLMYPGHGWSTLAERSYTITRPVGRGASLQTNLVTLTAGGKSRATMYWYQVGGRPIAGDHWYRAFLLYRRVVVHRVDGALVRVAAPISASGEPSALETLAEFVDAFQPALAGVLMQEVKG